MNASSIKVSIIVPNYNNAIYIKECIDSIINQSYKDIQIIVIDDGSTDGGDHLAEQHLLKNFSGGEWIFHRQSNQGPGAARNTGLSIAKGDFVCFVDGDDYIHKDMINILVNAITTLNCDLVSCNQVLFFQSLGLLKPLRSKIPSNIPLKGEEYADFDPTVSCCDKIFRYDFLKSIDFRFPVGRFAEDALAITEAIYKASRAAHVAIVLYYYRRQQVSSTTNNKSQNHLIKLIDDKIFVVKKLIELKRKNGWRGMLERRIIGNAISPFFWSETPIKLKLYYLHKIFGEKNLIFSIIMCFGFKNLYRVSRYNSRSAESIK